MAWLRKAIEHGYDKRDLMERDPDLENLRHLPEFYEILREIDQQ
jgi:hypothetical protein